MVALILAHEAPAECAIAISWWSLHAEVRHALELQSFQVVQTRQGNENPFFDIGIGKAHCLDVSVFSRVANPCWSLSR